MIGQSSGEHILPASSSMFFDIFACAWDMLGHATSILRSIDRDCDVLDALEIPGKSHHTTLLPSYHLPFHPPPLYCTSYPITILNLLQPPIFLTHHPTSEISSDLVLPHSNLPSPLISLFWHLGGLYFPTYLYIPYLHLHRSFTRIHKHHWQVFHTHINSLHLNWSRIQPSSCTCG